ncbi:MAG: hypothetical protein ACYDAC_03765 [Candidatus Dormibacteria bacterium]
MSEDADNLVARAIDRVLEHVPGGIDSGVPDAAAKLQPWAETAAPPSPTSKRPLEDLLAQLRERVMATPEARAHVPAGRHPGLAFFDRFTRSPRPQPASGRGSSRRRRRGRAAPEDGRTVAPAAAPTSEPRSGGRRRRGKRRSGSAAPSAAAPAPTPSLGPPSGRRRRRGRRGRGGGGAAGGAGAAQP